MIQVKYSKKEKDFVIDYDDSPTGSYINDIICSPMFTEELQRRGYDLQTLRFSIKKLNGVKNSEAGAEEND